MTPKGTPKAFNQILQQYLENLFIGKLFKSS